jgi:transaldolase
MNATETLHDRGQSLWLDNITRELLESGTLARYINELAVTGLTSNPTIFDHAIKNSSRPADGGDGEEVLATFASAGVNVDALASQLQDEGAKSFVDSWNELMNVIAAKSADLAKAS